MGKDKCPECPKCLPGWLVQFGDLMSLLLTFFILLLSMAVMDKKKVEEYFQIMKKSMGFLDETTSLDDQTQEHSTAEGRTADEENSSEVQGEMAETTQEISEIVSDVNSSQSAESDQITIEKGKNEFVLDIPATIMFEEGEYDLKNPAAKRFITKIARVIRTMPQTFNIEIIGHTDTDRLKSDTIPRDAWDISALRSISVVKELIKNQIEPSALKVSAYASYHPKSDVATDNRRVEIRFFSQEDQKDILNQENFFDRLE